MHMSSVYYLLPTFLPQSFLSAFHFIGSTSLLYHRATRTPITAAHHTGRGGLLDEKWQKKPRCRFPLVAQHASSKEVRRPGSDAIRKLAAALQELISMTSPTNILIRACRVHLRYLGMIELEGGAVKGFWLVVGVIRFCHHLTVKGKCHHEGEGDIEQEGAEEVNGNESG